MPPIDMSPFDIMEGLYEDDPEQFEIYNNPNEVRREEVNLFDQLYAPYRHSYFEENLKFFYFGVLMYYFENDKYQADEILHNLSHTIGHGPFIGDEVNLSQLCLIRDMDYELEILLTDHGFASNDHLKNLLSETKDKMDVLNIEISNTTKQLLRQYNVLNLTNNSSSTLSNDSILSNISGIALGRPNVGKKKKRSSGKKKKRTSGKKKKRTSGKKKKRSRGKKKKRSSGKKKKRTSGKKRR